MRKTEKKGLKKAMRVTDITPQKEQSGEPIRLAAYCRVSSSSEDQLHSFATQIRYYRDYEKKHPECKLVDIYADEGLTGTCLDKRDELNRMLRDCQRGLIDRVITKSVSRLARNTEDILSMVRMLKSIGVSIYFEEQRLDSGTMNLEMFLTLPGMAAQQESISISQNLRWSCKKRMESGEFTASCVPFGYVMVNGQLEINEPEAEIIRRIFDMYLSGIGKFKIATILNSEGVQPLRSKSCWYHGSIQYILTNEKYIGDVLLQKFYTTEDLPFRKLRNHGEKPKYYVEDVHPPIIDREKWDSAQKLMASRADALSTQNKECILRGKLKCSECGWAFTRHESRGVPYWRSGCHNSEKHNCSRKRVREQAVYGAFIRMTLKLTLHCSEIIDPVIKQMEILQLMTNDSSSVISDIDGEIAKLSSQLLVVTKLYDSGILNQSEYAAQNNDLSNKIRELRSDRRKKISRDDEILDELRDLRMLLDATYHNWCFNEDLFRQIVNEIIVVSNSELRFRLIGGLEFTEYIKERELCKSK